MKKLIVVLGLLFTSYVTSYVQAEDSLLLIPANGEGENLIVSGPKKVQTVSSSEESLNEDLELLKVGEFDLENFAKEHLQIEAQVRASLMVLEVYGSAGVRTLQDYLEVGVDASLMLVAAGTDGALIPSVGTYVKVRLTPQKASTVYFKGRLYKAWNLADNRATNKEFGVGYEFNGDSHIELTVKEFKRSGESNFYFPFIGMGFKFGGPRERANQSAPLFN